jgi:1-acyl-sn-glycerol-3-phosphate acyltransferase
MVVLKALSVFVAGLLSLLAVGFMVREMQAVKVKAKTRQTREPQLRRLRQDPRTGIYYPEG